MANKTISDLTLRSNFSADVSIPVQDSAQTYRSTGAQIAEYFSNLLIKNPAYLRNLAVKAAAVSDDLIVEVVQGDGTTALDDAFADRGDISLRSRTITSGGYTSNAFDSESPNMSLTVPQFRTLGAKSGYPFSLYVYLYYDGTNTGLCVSPNRLDETALHDVLDVDGYGASRVYGNTAASNVALKMVGGLKWSNITTAGTWTTPTNVYSAYIDNNSPSLERRVLKVIGGAFATNWSLSTTPADTQWTSICWSPQLSLYVAVAANGSTSCVMSSPDGVTWTIRTGATTNAWQGVCWSPEVGLFVAVALSGTLDRVMTSPDGINWTSRTTIDEQWKSVCWSTELSLFVAVANSGTGNRVMTSPNGTTWTVGTSAADNDWNSVCWSPELGIFVAVGSTGTGNRVMTSPNGTTWTTRTSASNIFWNSVCWSPELGLFCASAFDGGGNQIMTSPDGLNWTSVSSPLNSEDVSGVCWSSELGLFCAVTSDFSGTQVMTSPDGLNWTLRTTGTNYSWVAICWSPELGIFAAVADGTGGTTEIMVSEGPGRGYLKYLY